MPDLVRKDLAGLNHSKPINIADKVWTSLRSRKNSGFGIGVCVFESSAIWRVDLRTLSQQNIKGAEKLCKGKKNKVSSEMSSTYDDYTNTSM